MTPATTLATPLSAGNLGCKSSLLADCVTAAQDRRLRAWAWRYVRRIDPVIARRIWRAVRERQRREYREAA